MLAALEILPRFCRGISRGLPGIEPVVPGNEEHTASFFRTVCLTKKALWLGRVSINVLETFPGNTRELVDFGDIYVGHVKEPKNVESFSREGFFGNGSNGRCKFSDSQPAALFSAIKFL